MNWQCSHMLKSHNGKAQPLGNDTQPWAYACFLSDGNQNQKRMEMRRKSVKKYENKNGCGCTELNIYLKGTNLYI